MGQQPAFPLGHGLSYTTFAYGPLRVLPAFHRGGGRQSPRPEHRRPRGRRSRPALRRLAGEPPKGPQGVSQTRSRPALDRDADAGPAGPVGEGRPRPHQHMGQPRRPLPADGRQLITRPPLDLDLRAPGLKPSHAPTQRRAGGRSGSASGSPPGRRCRFPVSAPVGGGAVGNAAGRTRPARPQERAGRGLRLHVEAPAALALAA